MMVTHDQEESLSMSDRVAVMSNGHILQVSSPDDLYDRPMNEEVASFIGTMNFFDAIIVSKDEKESLIKVAPFGDIKIENNTFIEGERIRIGVRPEKLQLLSDNPNNDSMVTIDGFVESFAYLGERSHYYVRVGDLPKPVAISSQNVSRAQINKFIEEKRKIWVSFEKDSLVRLNIP